MSLTQLRGGRIREQIDAYNRLFRIQSVTRAAACEVRGVEFGSAEVRALAEIQIV